jgi:hypothetical protein
MPSGLAAQPVPDRPRRGRRAFQLAEQLGSVNAAAAELGTTWPSLPKTFTRHGLGMPARNPEAVRQRAIAAARQCTGRPATPTLDPVFAALNPGALPARPRSPAELYQWVRRDEEYATLGASVVIELNSESHASGLAQAPTNPEIAGPGCSRPVTGGRIRPGGWGRIRWLGHGAGSGGSGQSDLFVPSCLLE